MHVCAQRGLHELHQPELTHASATSRSRLDTIYTNQHVIEQLDREVKSVALEWKPSLSNHRAVLMSRRAPQKLACGDGCVSESAYKHKDNARRVGLE